MQVQATLLDYAGDQELVLKAWIALSKYQTTAREILLLYGSEPEFRDILRSFGDPVIPVIQYFRENDVWTVKAIQSVTEGVRNTWDRVTGRGKADPGPGRFGPTERGWYAVNLIRHEGYDVLGQFAVDKEMKAQRNQTDRVVKALTSLFTSGVRKLETRSDLGEDITKADVFWAGLDVALVAIPAKLLVSGKAIARSGEQLGFATRTRLFAPRLLPKGQVFRNLGLFGAAAATVYVVAANPSLLNSIFAELASLAGISPWVVQVAGWSAVLFILAYVFSWLLTPIAKFLLFLLRQLEFSTKPH